MFSCDFFMPDDVVLVDSTHLQLSTASTGLNLRTYLSNLLFNICITTYSAIFATLKCVDCTSKSSCAFMDTNNYMYVSYCWFDVPYLLVSH